MSSPATGLTSASPVDDNAPTLTVLIGSSVAHAIDPEQAPVVIGRWVDPASAEAASVDPASAEAASLPPADIPVVDYRISRQHLVLSLRNGRWFATDPGSRNGTFINGEKVDEFEIPEDDAIVVHLGNPAAGIQVTFSPHDAGNVYAGAQFAAARRQLRLSQRALASDGVINAGALISFEKGRSWPRKATREKLEDVVHWKRGTIDKLRRDYANGGQTTAAVSVPVLAAVPDPEKTVVVPPAPAPAPPSPSREETGTSAIDPGFLAQWARQNLALARAHRAELPAASKPAYQPAVARLISELASLELLVHNASATPELRPVFLQVRNELREVMLAAAESPTATSGQRLFAVRDRDRLSVEDAAMLAGVPAESVRAFETGGEVPATDKAVLENFLASLQ